MSLVPLPSEQSPATCSGCGAPLVADQRYCLSCGRPCSPVRLAFLDALGGGDGARPAQSTFAAGPGLVEVGPAGLLPVQDPGGMNAWLRRNSGLLGLLAILVLCLLSGLLIGHWASAGKSSGNAVIKVEGLGGLSAGSGASTNGSGSEAEAGGGAASKKSEEKEAAEAAKETAAEKAPPPKPVKVSKTKLETLTKSTGKKHQEEVNKLGDKPIEVP